MKRERKLAQIPSLLHLFISLFSSPNPLLPLTSLPTPAAFYWLFSSNYLVGSTLTQLRFHSSSSSSPASSVRSKAPSLTSTPTHLPEWVSAPAQLRFFSCSGSISAASPSFLFSQTGTHNSAAVIWLWLHFGPDCIWHCASSGFDSYLL